MKIHGKIEKTEISSDKKRYWKIFQLISLGESERRPRHRYEQPPVPLPVAVRRFYGKWWMKTIINYQ